MPVISVIVPVYNVEKYLHRCVDSILAQTFEQLEIILVDDGSTDNSAKICDNYAQMDSRIRVIHKENRGLSSARNVGLDVAQGDWIGFVDSDDYIDPDMYEYLHAKAVNEEAQIAMCEMYHCYEGKEIICHPADFYKVTDRVEAARIVMEARITSVTVVNKLYRREIFSNLRFRVGKTAEDAFIILDVLSKAERIVISNAQKYYYYRRANSITTKPFNERDLDTVEAYEYNAKRAIEISDSLADVALLRQCWARIYVLDKIMLSGTKLNTDIVKKYTAFLRKHISFIMQSEVFRPSRKIAIAVLMINAKLYRLVVRRYLAHNRKPNA